MFIKYYKLVLIILIMLLFFIGSKFELEFLTLSISIFIIIATYVYITRSALENLFDCFYYLIIVAPMFGAIISYYADTSGFLPNFEFSDYVYYEIAYFIIWLLIVIFGKLKVVKLATLIIAQTLTAFFLVSNLIINLIPIRVFNEYLLSINTDYMEFQTIMGYSSRGIFEVILQILLYPALFNAILIYLVAEIKEYLREKKTNVVA